MREDELNERLRQLNGTRRMDRFMQWVAGIAGTLVTIAIVGLTVTVIDLKAGTAISNEKLTSSIDKLAAKLDAASDIAALNLGNVLKRVDRNVDIIERNADRIVTIEKKIDLVCARLKACDPSILEEMGHR